MHRSRLKNIYIKKNNKNWENCKKQTNFCVELENRIL